MKLPGHEFSWQMEQPVQRHSGRNVPEVKQGGSVARRAVLRDEVMGGRHRMQYCVTDHYKDSGFPSGKTGATTGGDEI